MDKAITIIQILVSVSLVVVILMQNRGSSLSGVFGGSGSVFRTKRGVEKTLYYITIILAILFIGLSIAGVLI